ncbi:MAG: hypothetical protein EOO59_09810 [Hymenobacter sp.]|nr:MAG: hypothetical protein EOO59_09810 [Hymenobacter sp.]
MAAAGRVGKTWAVRFRARPPSARGPAGGSISSAGVWTRPCGTSGTRAAGATGSAWAARLPPSPPA